MTASDQGQPIGVSSSDQGERVGVASSDQGERVGVASSDHGQPVGVSSSDQGEPVGVSSWDQEERVGVTSSGQREPVGLTPSDRRVVVLVVPARGTWAPPGRDPEAWRLALAEDTYEVLAGLDRVDVAVAVAGGSESTLSEVADLTWPGTPVYTVDPNRPVLDAVQLAGPAAAVVAVSHDVPDLPGLLIGKLFRALSTADIAVTPSEDGSLAAIGVNLPTADWVATVAPTFDTPLSELESHKPRRHAVAIGPGWHRLRSSADIARLDPGLEGWDATRSLLRRS